MASRERKQIPQGVRFDVFRRDNFACVYCGRGSPDVTLHCDHKVAHSKGGSDDQSNLVTACSDCNYGKSAKTVKMARGTRQVANDNGLVGLYGHTRDDDGAIHWQFQVTGMVGDSLATIQLFSWLDGRPTDVKVIPLADLMQCSLYSTYDEWIWRWAKEAAVASGQGEDRVALTFRLTTGREYGEAA